MPDRVPPEVLALLQARDASSRDAAWERIVASHSKLLLHVARSVIHDADRVMDAYAWVLERLHEDEARRLRGFSVEGRSKFSTWLVVVARRLCVDFLRAQGGRSRPGMNGQGPAPDSQGFRRRLLAMAGDSVDLDTLGSSDPGPDRSLLSAERHELLLSVLHELSADDQLLLRLRFEDELQADAIARVLRFPTRFHVYRRIDQVLHRLRGQLEGKGMHDAS